MLSITINAITLFSHTRRFLPSLAEIESHLFVPSLHFFNTPMFFCCYATLIFPRSWVLAWMSIRDEQASGIPSSWVTAWVIGYAGDHVFTWLPCITSTSSASCRHCFLCIDGPGQLQGTATTVEMAPRMSKVARTTTVAMATPPLDPELSPSMSPSSLILH